MDIVKISAISYINALPYKYAFENSNYLKNNAKISYDIPSVCLEKLKSNNADIGLIPLAGLLELQDFEIISEFGISSYEKVFSVLLLSNKDINEIDNVILDYQSRTSVNMFKILCRDYLKRDFKFINAKQEFIDEIKGNTAGLVIGDRAMIYRDKFKYVYDLSELWLQFTSTLPVYAVWTANKKIHSDFINEFNTAIKKSFVKFADIIEKYKKDYPTVDLQNYLQNNIAYELDEIRKQGGNLFYSKLTNTNEKIFV